MLGNNLLLIASRWPFAGAIFVFDYRHPEFLYEVEIHGEKKPE
jgi:hypothetical protein